MTPLSLVLGGVVVVLMVATAINPALHGQLVHALSVSWPALNDGRLWRLPSSSLVQEDPGISWPIVALLPALPVTELALGSLRALAVYVACDAASSVLALGALELIGDDRLAAEPNIGSSAGLLGLLAAWVARLPARLRATGAVLLLLGVGIAAAVRPELAAVQHLIALAVGGLLGSWTTHLRPGTSRP